MHTPRTRLWVTGTDLQGHPVLRRIHPTPRSTKVTLDSEVRNDSMWWLTFLPYLNSMESLQPPAPGAKFLARWVCRLQVQTTSAGYRQCRLTLSSRLGPRTPLAQPTAILLGSEI